MVFSAEGAARDLAPRPASTVILLRDGPVAPEVFLLRRSGKSAFFGGAFVFPGGKVDESDGGDDIPGAERLPSGAARLVGRGGGVVSEAERRAAFVAGARELFEEAGVLLAQGSLPHSAQLESDRRRLHGGEVGLGRLLRERGLALALDVLVPFAHWVTPSLERRRFDTRFFLAPLPPGQVAAADESETTSGLWSTASGALARHRRRQVFLPPPTQRILEELELAGRCSVAELLEQASARPIHPVLPRIRLLEQGVEIHLPHSPDYPELDGEAERLPEAAPERRFAPTIRVPPEAGPDAAEVPTEAVELLEYWLGGSLDGIEAPPEVTKRWWTADPAFDAELAERFGGLHADARAGRLSHWEQTPEGSLALVILLDQLSRNLSRDSTAAYENDAAALALAERAIERGDDQALSPKARAFFYMPLMHAEDLRCQKACQLAFARLDEATGAFGPWVEAAARHRADIERFGRFPYRKRG